MPKVVSIFGFEPVLMKVLWAMRDWVLRVHDLTDGVIRRSSSTVRD
jgi:hypothetical protein